MSTDVARLQASPATGYQARPFDDRDREALVEMRNAEVHPVQRSTAAEWRHRERVMPDETLFLVKVQALALAKAKGLRAMLTTNDEPNRAMRGINTRLGYEPLPAHVALEKKLA